MFLQCSLLVAVLVVLFETVDHVVCVLAVIALLVVYGVLPIDFIYPTWPSPHWRYLELVQTMHSVRRSFLSRSLLAYLFAFLSMYSTYVCILVYMYNVYMYVCVSREELKLALVSATLHLTTTGWGVAVCVCHWTPGSRTALSVPSREPLPVHGVYCSKAKLKNNNNKWLIKSRQTVTVYLLDHTQLQSRSLFCSSSLLTALLAYKERPHYKFDKMEGLQRNLLGRRFVVLSQHDVLLYTPETIHVCVVTL